MYGTGKSMKVKDRAAGHGPADLAEYGRLDSRRLQCIRDGRIEDVMEFWHVVTGKACFGRPIRHLPDQVAPSTDQTVGSRK